mmetsp:Transcript_68342/g.182066  ORF Transcript_68342/g.182066 Transcript_68342/m.182066 type:complete len:631 (+) Transcript_68342:1217-3109(+)
MIPQGVEQAVQRPCPDLTSLVQNQLGEPLQQLHPLGRRGRPGAAVRGVVGDNAVAPMVSTASAALHLVRHALGNAHHAADGTQRPLQAQIVLPEGHQSLHGVSQVLDAQRVVLDHNAFQDGVRQRAQRVRIPSPHADDAQHRAPARHDVVAPGLDQVGDDVQNQLLPLRGGLPGPHGHLEGTHELALEMEPTDLHLVEEAHGQLPQGVEGVERDPCVGMHCGHGEMLGEHPPDLAPYQTHPVHVGVRDIQQPAEGEDPGLELRLQLFLGNLAQLPHKMLNSRRVQPRRAVEQQINRGSVYLAGDLLGVALLRHELFRAHGQDHAGSGADTTLGEALGGAVEARDVGTEEARGGPLHWAAAPEMVRLLRVGTDDLQPLQLTHALEHVLPRPRQAVPLRQPNGQQRLDTVDVLGAHLLQRVQEGELRQGAHEGLPLVVQAEPAAHADAVLEPVQAELHALLVVVALEQDGEGGEHGPADHLEDGLHVVNAVRGDVLAPLPALEVQQALRVSDDCVEFLKEELSLAHAADAGFQLLLDPSLVILPEGKRLRGDLVIQSVQELPRVVAVPVHGPEGLLGHLVRHRGLLQVGLQHDHGKREHVHRVGVREALGALGVVPPGKSLHHAVNLLSLPR